jgi:exopolyphosphatase/guanosine-5'-triphosphate,3'-diphosphate pyrophosphatase
MRCACIDIGSNTTRLAGRGGRDGSIRAIVQERAFTRIGHGLAPGGEIAEPKIEEVAAVVAAQAARAAEHGATSVRAVATAAIRARPTATPCATRCRAHGLAGRGARR